MQKLQIELRDKLLAVPGEDWARYQDFLKLSDTGLVKLLPRGKYEDTVVGMREGGAYYSFTRKTHEYGYGSDIELNRDSRFQVGFAGNDYGYFLPLGDVPIEDVAQALSSVPKWANESVARGWKEMWGRTPVSPEAIRDADAMSMRGREAKQGIRAEPGKAYLLRSISSDADTLIGLRVLRKFDDGSVVIAYRILKRFDLPPNAKPRRLPTTRFP